MLLDYLLPNRFSKSAPDSTGADPLLSSAAISRALDRERMRSDRSGSSFCLLAIQFLERPLAENAKVELGELLKGRLRLTDDAGWLERGRLGVVLPETSGDGARKVACDLAELFGTKFGFTQIQIFEYPESDSTTPDRESETAGAWQARAETGISQQVLPMVALMAQRAPAWKRTMDVVAAAMGLVVLSPLLILVALLVKLTSRGPVFFRQWREGFAGHRFRMVKFRTMRVGAELLQAQYRAASEQDGPAFKLRNDPRVTWIGRFLRKSCIDELPQLMNVIFGDMSLVGPRPLPVMESEACERWHRRRLDVVPGLTCDWQANGGLRVAFSEWMRMDVRYARRIVLSRDLYLLGKTFMKVVTFRASH